MTHTRFLRIGLAAALAFTSTVSTALAFTPAQRVPPGKSMLFRVKAPNSGATVYLFGSVHLLNDGAAKLPAVVDSAFAKARVVAFETSLDTLQMRAAEMLMRAQYRDGATLRSSLSPAAYAKADSIVKAYGLPIEQLNGFKPWFVSLALTQVALQRANFRADLGADAQLNARAKQQSKTVTSLEAVDFQMGLFDSIMPEDQEKMLMQTESPDSTARSLSRITEIWMTGNTVRLDSLLNSRLSQSRGLFATLITNRNRDWIPKLEQFAKGKDDVFVVVGAAHLVGKEGVLEMLKAKGYSIEQM
jgi:uncharacterized protein YbaP (TraB family)